MIQPVLAIDLIDGKCVRLTEGDFDQRTDYVWEAAQLAIEAESAGLERLHIVDLDGARTGTCRNLDVLDQIAHSTRLVIDFSGGVRSVADAERTRNAGAAIVGIGSLAVRDPETAASIFAALGGEHVLLCADVRDQKVAIQGWQEQTDIDLDEFVGAWLEHGLQRVMATDIHRDGRLAGPAFELYKHLNATYPSLKLTASGGVTDMSDLEALGETGVDEAIVGKAFYEGRLSLEQLGGIACRRSD